MIGTSAQASHDTGTTVFLYLCGAVGLVFAFYLFREVASVKLPEALKSSENGSTRQPLLETEGLSKQSAEKILKIYAAISNGADSFLFAEYRICAIFIVCFGGLVFLLTSRTTETVCRVVPLHDGSDDTITECVEKSIWDFTTGGLTTASFAIGAVTSIISGYIGMKIAVFSNARTTLSAIPSSDLSVSPWTASFTLAFRAGGVMAYSLTALGLMVLYSLILGYETVYEFGEDPENRKKLFEAVAGFGLGASSIALFGRVGGGIFTKAADVGADLAGKVVQGIPEDDPRNPAVIADNVGDCVGDVAGMGSDLFGSFAEATCAALVISAGFDTQGWGVRQQLFPLVIAGTGMISCLLVSFIATHVSPVALEHHIERVLKLQILFSSLLTSILLIPALFYSFAHYDSTLTGVTLSKVYICILSGLWSGALIGFITEFYTSHSYSPTREVASSCETGAATNIIYGLALGYKSVVIPVLLLSTTVFVTFGLLGLYGISLAALGMLATLATCLTIDVYGPISDNAGGIAEMAGLDSKVRETTDALDAAGNTTAAIGKGFAIGSACLVGLALFGAFVKRSELSEADVSVLEPVVFAFILVGAMLPYWFSALTMKSVGKAAKEMVAEVARQFREIPGLLNDEPGRGEPDHAACIMISTNASLKEMIAPAVLIISAPILSGLFFGSRAVCGLLTGAISSSVQMAISASNTGGAWDNAKKYIEKGSLVVDGKRVTKGSEIHKAAVTGDTVGDPLKDTSGPALNIVMKLMAILSLVMADFFKSVNNGQGLIHWN